MKNGFTQRKFGGNEAICQYPRCTHFQFQEILFTSKAQNLIAQAERLFRHNRQGSYKTRERYSEAFLRFCRFLAERYHLEKLKNIAPKHLRAYAAYMQERNLSASTIKTDLAAIRFWYDQIPYAHNRLPDNTELELERRSFGKTDRAWTQSEFNRFI